MGRQERSEPSALARPAREVVWRPQPGPQRAFVRCPLDDVVYGGARGGGKTDAALGEFGVHAMRYGANAKGLFVRRTRIALMATIERARQIYRGLAEWKEQQSRFVFNNGATVRFNYLERDADAEQYQGHDYTRVYVEELTQFPSPEPINKLRATLRSGAGVPTGFRATCNPGGAGHGWVKQRYIDSGPWVVTRHPFKCPYTGNQIMLSRVFIPALLSDNPALLNNDPGYVARLNESGSPQLVKAWLEGDWNIVEGAFFSEWSTADHVLSPFELPSHWAKFRSFDWGFARPFSCGWWAVATEDLQRPEGVIPRGALIRYREWYGAASANVGLRHTVEEVADEIVARELKVGERSTKMGDRLMGVADPAMFAQNGGPSMAETMALRGAVWRPADNTRVAKAGAIGGWDQVRARLRGVSGRPLMYVFSTCKDTIRTLPALQHDDLRPEDVDSSGEDHAADEIRYACSSRPVAAKAPVPDTPRDGYRRRGKSEDSWKTV